MKPKQTATKPACIPRDIALQAAMIRLGEVDHEIRQGYEILRKYHKTVTFFGSARTKDDNPDYIAADDLSEKLALKGYAIVSGGGNGIMSAANEGAHTAVQNGAKKAGGESIAFNIKLPHEQHINPYATESYEFAHFAPRKIVMTMYANAYVYFPGGFGTIDELTEVLTLIQTGKTIKAPVILFGSDYWTKFDKFVKETMLPAGMISPGDEQLYTITDSVEEAIKIVEKNQTYCNH